MNAKWLNLLLVLASGFGYIEWSGNNRAFLFEVEGEFFTKLFTDPLSVLHPFTVVPLAGQLILLFTLLQSKPGKVLTWTGITGIGLLFVFLFIVGILSLNTRIIFSTVPFLFLAVWRIRQMSKGRG